MKINLKNNTIEFSPIASLQLGGAINMTEEKKKELFPYFAYIYSKQLNPEKYGSVTSVEEGTNLIGENEEDIKAITQAASKLSNDEWEAISQQYLQAQTQVKSDELQFAKKGAKLKELKKVEKKQSGGVNFVPAKSVLKKISSQNNSGPVKKDGGPIEEVNKSASNPVLTQGKKGMKAKRKKCSCGCDLILSRAVGGKVIETCSCKCGGKMKKKK